MRRIDRALNSVNNGHRREAYVGPIASTNSGGHATSVNNLHNSQVNGTQMMPYGISSRAMSGMKAQAIVNDNNENAVVGVYDPMRPKVGVGEVCLYSSGGCSVYLSASGVVSIDSGDASVTVSNGTVLIHGGAVVLGNVKITGNIEIEGNIKLTGDIESEGTIKNTGNIEIDGDIKASGSGDIGSSLKVNGQTMDVP